MCFFAVTGGTVTVIIVFYHGNGLHGNYRTFTAVKIPRGNPRGKPWKNPSSCDCTEIRAHIPTSEGFEVFVEEGEVSGTRNVTDTSGLG